MGPIAIRCLTRRLRRHLTGVVMVVALGGAIAAHHSEIPLGEDHHEGMSAAVEMCVGAFTAVGATVAAVVVGILALGRWATVVELAPHGPLASRSTAATPARAGPSPPHALLSVWRR